MRVRLTHGPLFRPPDRIGNGAHRGRNTCPAVVLSQLSFAISAMPTRYSFGTIEQEKREVES
jgi:hypothetical protein